MAETDIPALYEALADALDAEGHDLECVFRCVSPGGRCGDDHGCSVCSPDEEDDPPTPARYAWLAD